MMATTRERRLAKAERLDEWADKRAANAKVLRDRNEPYASDWAFITQPGHIPERARVIARIDRAHADTAKATSMSSRAAGIRAATEASIFDDDDDAVQALTDRIAGLEAQRVAIVEFNKAARKAKGDTKLIAAALAELPADLQRSYLSAVQHAPYSIRNGAFPAYHLSNLSGSISKQRKRLEQLQKQAALEPGTVTRRCTNRYAGDCRVCGVKVEAEAGMAEKLHGEGWTVRHHGCSDRESR
jgi:hypothetical protein